MFGSPNINRYLRVIEDDLKGGAHERQCYLKKSKISAIKQVILKA